ncbi:Ubiquitin-conjugating enzyme E2 J1-like protein [Aphelenchoides fujianensis]|nr:Ubiquitin-conjugating enzyme E2 J1-like protein [Aphelenchoides fujianensis]
MAAANGAGDLSTRSAGVKRLLKEAKELHKPNHMTTSSNGTSPSGGSPDTDYAGGIYHGRIVLPHDYPMKPPHLLLLTENGRFETHTKICLSISGHHPETWLPSWSIRTAILALIAFFPQDAEGVGSLKCSSEARRRLAESGLPLRNVRLRDARRAARIGGGRGRTGGRTPSAQRENAEVVELDTTESPQASEELEPSMIEEILPVASVPDRPPLLLYAFCLLACITGFLALLIRRLGA